ncbi:hypothetical protein BDR26DRAFT_853732, partial [Obelidium mucronatum]
VSLDAIPKPPSNGTRDASLSRNGRTGSEKSLPRSPTSIPSIPRNNSSSSSSNSTNNKPPVLGARNDSKKSIKKSPRTPSPTTPTVVLLLDKSLPPSPPISPPTNNSALVLENKLDDEAPPTTNNATHVLENKVSMTQEPDSISPDAGMVPMSLLISPEKHSDNQEPHHQQKQVIENYKQYEQQQQQVEHKEQTEILPTDSITEYTKPDAASMARFVKRKGTDHSLVFYSSESVHSSAATPDLLRISMSTPDSMVSATSLSLASQVKQYIAAYPPVPRLSSITELSPYTGPSLITLPDKILTQIILHLSQRDMTHLTSTCTHLSTLCTTLHFMSTYILHSLGPTRAFLNIMNTPVSADRNQLLDALFENLGAGAGGGGGGAGGGGESGDGNGVLSGLIEFCVEKGEANGLRELLFRQQQQQQHQPLFRYLKKCVWMGDVDCLEVLLENMSEESVGGNSAGIVLEKGGDSNTSMSSDSLSFGGAVGELLCIAVERGRIGVLDRLLTVPGIVSDSGALNRALCVLAKGAVDAGDVMHRADIAGKLVLAGADVTSNGYEAFKSAAASGDSEVFKVLVRDVVGGAELKRRRSTLGLQAAAAAAAASMAKLSGASSGALLTSPVSFELPHRHGLDLGRRPSTHASSEDMTETDHAALEQVYMIVATQGQAASMKVLLSESRTWSMPNGIKRNLIPATLKAVSSGWVGVVKAITESKCWLEIVKEVGGDVLLDQASRYVFENEALSLDEPVRIRKLLERPVAQIIDGDGVIPHSAAMVEAMIAGVAGTTAARFTAFETTIMKKGIDSHSFLISAKPNDRDSPFQAIKDKVLLQAVWLGHEAVMDAVITVLQPDLTGPVGQSVLVAAACQGHTKIVASLISAGVDFESGGGIVFDIAQDRGHLDTLKHLKMMREIRVKVAKDAEVKAKERAKKRSTTII